MFGLDLETCWLYLQKSSVSAEAGYTKKDLLYRSLGFERAPGIITLWCLQHLTFTTPCPAS